MSDAVASALRELDRDAYFASLFVPGEARAAVQALWAFGAEIAAVPARVSEPMPGEIRLQWWTDTLGGTARGEAAQNPVAFALKQAVSEHDLQTGPLLRLIAARRFDLYADPMPDMATFEGYVGETLSVLIQYAALVLAKGGPAPVGDAAGHLGVALALFGHVLAFGYNASRGRLFLPMDRFTAHGVDDRQILAGRASPQLTATLRALVSEGDEHLGKARAALDDISGPLRPAFARIALSAGMRTAALRAAEKPFTPPRLPGDLGKLWALAMWRMAS
jgi:15-cis-phytoene synthase